MKETFKNQQIVAVADAIQELKHLGDIPNGAVRLSNGNGWCYTPYRCVYGYWTFAGGAA